MYKTIIIEGERPNIYQENLNKFYKENKNIKVVHIEHIIRNHDDYMAIITYKESE